MTTQEAIFVRLDIETQIAIQRLEQRGFVWGEHFATREAVEMAALLDGEGEAEK